jgi:hypothetical protein
LILKSLSRFIGREPKGDCKYQISQKIQKNKKSGSISKYKMKMFPIPLNPPLNGKYSIPLHDKSQRGTSPEAGRKVTSTSVLFFCNISLNFRPIDF